MAYGGLVPEFGQAAEKLREAVAALLAVDACQDPLTVHRLSNCRPLADHLTKIAELIEEDKVGAANLELNKLIYAFNNNVFAESRPRALAEFGAMLLGQSKSEKKAAQARINGSKSRGRPKKVRI